MPTFEIPLIARYAMSYAGRTLAKGQRFYATRADASLLKALDRAVDAPLADEVHESSDSTLIDAMEAAPPVRRRRQYRRKDLVAED